MDLLDANNNVGLHSTDHSTGESDTLSHNQKDEGMNPAKILESGHKSEKYNKLVKEISLYKDEDFIYIKRQHMLKDLLLQKYPYLERKLSTYFDMKFVDKMHLDDGSYKHWSVYDVSLEIPHEIDSKVTLILNQFQMDAYDHNLYFELVPQDELNVHWDEFDRMMSQWDFIMTFQQCLNIDTLTPFEMYIAMSSQEVKENPVFNKIILAFLDRFITYSQWYSKNNVVQSFRNMSPSNRQKCWISIMKLQVS